MYSRAEYRGTSCAVSTAAYSGCGRGSDRLVKRRGGEQAGDVRVQRQPRARLLQG